MNNQDFFKKPVGEISMYLYKDGYYDDSTNQFSLGSKILKEQNIKNLIVNSASILMAARMAPGSKTGSSSDLDVLSGSFSGYEKGFQYLAIGDGNNTVPPNNDISVSKLVGEVARASFSNWTFLDNSGNSVNTLTNIMKLSATFDESQAVGAQITEMGLYGGNANAAKDTGTLFNYKTFPVWTKSSGTKLTVIWKITF